MASRRPIDFAAIRRAVSPLLVLQSHQWPGRREPCGTWRGPCPLHGSRSPRSRSLAVCERVYYCHSCRRTGDAVQLRALLCYEQVYEAAIQVCGLAGIQVPYIGGLFS